MPKMIIMMPARNAAATIDIAIRSTLKAMPRDAKILVWDDGSTDSTVGVVERYLGPRLEVFRSPRSVGGGAARAEMMRRTDSEIVACMDADDICLPWRFTLQLNHLQTVDVSFTTHFKFGANLSKWRPTLPFKYRPYDVRTALAIHNPLTHPSLVGKRSTIVASGGYRDLQVAQDYDLWMRVAAGGHAMGRLAQPGLAYRQAASQVSKQVGFENRIRAQEPMVKSYLDLLQVVAPGAVEAAREATSNSEARLEVVRALKENVSKMSPHLRTYYRRLLSQGRFGPLWGSWERNRGSGGV